MPYSINCPNCMHSFVLGQDEITDKVLCPECSHRFAFKKPTRGETGAAKPAAPPARAAAPPMPKPQPPVAPPPKPHAPVVASPPKTPAAPRLEPSAPIAAQTKPSVPTLPGKPRPSPPTSPIPFDAEHEEGTVIGQMERMPLPQKTKGPPSMSKSRSRIALKPPSEHEMPDEFSTSRKIAGLNRNVALTILLVLGVGALGLGGYFAFRGSSEQKDKEKVADATPALPANPDLLGRYGGIEIGSSSVKRIAVEYYSINGKVVLKPFDPLDVETKLGDIPEGSKNFAPNKLDVTVKQVGDYFKYLRDNLEIPVERIYIVCSSGLMVGLDRERNENELIKRVREKTGKTPEFIDANDETKYAFKGVVPKEEWTSAVLIDVGGRSIKGGGFDKRGNYLDFSAEVGANSFGAAIVEDKKGNKADDIRANARRLVGKKVKEPLQMNLKDSPAEALLQRKKVYFLGGVPWAMVTYTRTVEYYGPQLEFWRTMKFEDIAKFDDMVLRDPKNIKKDLEKTLPQKESWAEEARDNIAKIQTVVYKKQERLIAGAQIMAAIGETFALNEKEMFSHRLGLYGWLLGYVGTKSGHLK